MSPIEKTLGPRALLRSISYEEFLSKCWLRMPHSEPGGCEDLAPVGDPAVLQALLLADPAAVHRAREGQALGERGAAPAMTVIKHAERHVPELARVARAFEEELSCPVDVHFLHTEEAAQGYVWHCDVEEVFILQVKGAKRYSLRKNTVHPWPLRETIDVVPYEREGSQVHLECRLEPGDWLYLPAGWWHVAVCESECVTLSVGLSPTTGIDVWDRLRRAAVASPLWRRRLPPAVGPVSVVDERRALLRAWAEDLRRRLEDDFDRRSSD